MKKILTLLFLILSYSSMAVYTTNGGSTNFTSGAAWTGGSAPSMTQWDGSHDANVSHNLTYTGDLTISSTNVLTVKNGATLTITGALKMGWNSINGLVIEAGGKVIVNSIQYDSSPSDIINNGTLQVTTTFTLGTNGSFTSTGTFSTGGNLTISSSGDVDLSGTNTIGGNISASGAGTDFDLNGGTLSVSGDVTLNGNATTTLAGPVTVGGDYNQIGAGGASTVSNTLSITGQLLIGSNAVLRGTGIVQWGSVSTGAGCGSGSYISCDGTGGTLDTDGDACYADIPGNPLDLNTCTGGALPVELIEFYLIDDGNLTTLYWTTGSEINNDYFEVQTSIDCINWVSEGRVIGMGNSIVINHYDYQVKSSSKYFRLKQVDFDGTQTYSKIIVSNSSISENIITSSRYFIMVLNEERYIVSIYKIDGALVYEEEHEGRVFISKSGFSPGVYLVRVNNQNMKIYVHGD